MAALSTKGILRNFTAADFAAAAIGGGGSRGTAGSGGGGGPTGATGSTGSTGSTGPNPSPPVAFDNVAGASEPEPEGDGEDTA